MTPCTSSRESSSPLVDHVASHDYTQLTHATSLPDGCWDLVVIRDPLGQTHAMITGAITKPIHLGFGDGYKVFNIAFRPEAFVPHLSARALLNGDLKLPTAAPGKVWIGSHVVELPTYDNAESFIDKMTRNGLIVRDKLVASVLSNNPMAASERSVQRHFLQTTGMSYKAMQQINRSWTAINMLRSGTRTADVAHSLGFTDQAHMTHVLKAIMGLTPAAIAKTPI